MPTPKCYACGIRDAALPMAYCLDCYGRLRGANDLVGAHEIAQRLGIQPDTVRQWLIRHSTFPRPLITVAAGKIWRWTEIENWHRERHP